MRRGGRASLLLLAIAGDSEEPAASENDQCHALGGFNKLIVTTRSNLVHSRRGAWYGAQGEIA